MLAERIATEQPDRRAGTARRRGHGRARRARVRAQRLPARPDRAPALHARGRAARERDRPAGGRLATPDRDRRRARRRAPCRTAPAAPPTPPRCSSSRASSRAGRRARRSCSPRSTARRSARSAPSGSSPSSARPDFVDAVLVMSSLGSDAEEPSVAGLVERRPARRHRPAADAWRSRSARSSTARGRRRRRLSASSRGSPSRSASGRRARCSPRATRRCGSRAAASCRRRATGPVEEIDEDRLGALGRATLRTVTALDQGRRPEHGPGVVRAGGEPGAARLGDLAVRGRAAAAGARGVGRRVRAGAPAPPGRAALAALRRRLGGALPRRSGARRAARG